MTGKERQVLLRAIDLAVSEYECSDEKELFKDDISILNGLSEKMMGKAK